ncbi:uncharacterized protein LOC123411769 [Hordeum vulgare subsp. vulgare]|uniref:uncharacterized protein LOC123411769 n=1 Tax=Hordeum vulgare subsp. vulgare TaxID=112509 RepID=UPI001D1A5229|nr:uncharacterized protein LOC123411769 [Hordeum vulgare subsp. vulgare]
MSSASSTYIKPDHQHQAPPHEHPCVPNKCSPSIALCFHRHLRARERRRRTSTLVAPGVEYEYEDPVENVPEEQEFYPESARQDGSRTADPEADDAPQLEWEYDEESQRMYVTYPDE